LLPNLKAFPASDIAVVPHEGGTIVEFTTLTWNSGAGALEVVAGETGSAGRNVYQRVFLGNGGSYLHLAGTFEWHEAHSHIHFEDYALYTLQLAGAPGGSQRTSAKTTFCIMDTNQIDLSLPDAPNNPNYTTCGDLVQGMDVGWGDKYGYWLAGQDIDITGLDDGDYTLTIEVDPKSHLRESNDDDNTSCILLRISVTNQTVQVLNDTDCSGSGGGGDPGGGDVVITSIEPYVVNRGTVTEVTILGSGFVGGMEVAFQGASGPRPKVSGITVVNEGKITANVTVKAKGRKRTRTWDLRVGSDVLAGALTVEP
jgi:hypothetical protein